jgi:para-nitrobenzyl esterase
VPVTPWAGVRDATEFGAPCAQTPMLQPALAAVSKEDCLFLNVWTAEWPSRSPKSVMVWVPGGGNFTGGSSLPVFNGESLASHGVVLVTLNYRLGVFGFFSHPLLTREAARHASGNQGILDQIAALKWVHENIASFGGDPSNVTIFGESAGSVDVIALLASPLSKGLFHRAIGESGTGIEPDIGDPLTLTQAEKRGDAISARWQLASEHSAKDLRGIPMADILKAEPDYRAALTSDFPNLGITIDGYVFPMSPSEVFVAGQEHRVALLLANNSRERVPGTTPPADLRKAINGRYGPLSERGWSLYATASDDPVYGTPADQWVGDISFRCSAVAQLMWHSAAPEILLMSLSLPAFRLVEKRSERRTLPNCLMFSVHSIVEYLHHPVSL